MDRFYISKGWEFNRDSACKGWDLILNDTKIEEKFIYNDCGNILIEILQDVISFNRGWYYYTTADRVFFIVTHRELYSVNWPIFKEWLIDEMKKGKAAEDALTHADYKAAGLKSYVARELRSVVAHVNGEG